MNSERFIVIQGPTACGKSRIAEQLAMEFDGEIISADSRQVYRYLDIGTAKPNKATQEKVKYHLLDIVNPDEEYNAGLFARDARKLISEIQDRGKVPLVTGGTGFYVSALLQGLALIPSVTKEAKQKVWQLFTEMPSKEIFKYLQKIDPVAAKRIDINDKHRQQRAIEVYESSGKPLSWFWQQQEKKYLNENYLNIILQLPRAELYDRINLRIDKMLDDGLIDEIRNLLAIGYSENDPGMITVGYREFYPWIKNQVAYTSAVETAKQHSRNYAKRQLTWYKKQEFDLTITPDALNLLILRKRIRKYIKKGE